MIPAGLIAALPVIQFGLSVLREGAGAVRELIEEGRRSGELTAEEYQAQLAQLATDQQSAEYRTDADIEAGRSAAPAPLFPPGTPIPQTPVPRPDSVTEGVGLAGGIAPDGSAPGT